MDFFDAVGSQRACRSFTDEPVSDADLERLLKAATFAPSAENRQPWEFVVVTDEERRAAIGELMVRLWEGGAREYARSRDDGALFAEVDEALSSGLASAPVLVVVGADTDKVLEISMASSIWPAIQNLLLAATALGLGSALTTIATFLGDELSAVVGLPDHVAPVAVIPVGHPARRLGPPRREHFSQHAHREDFAGPWSN